MRVDDYVRLIRPAHWVKNGIIIVPLFFTPELVTKAATGAVTVTVTIFCLMTSAVYVFNDWADRKADAAHPIKRFRPIASGRAEPRVALILALALALGSLAFATAFEPDVLPYVAAYAGLNIAYSLYLKHIAIVDVCVIALGFIIRVQAGVAAIHAVPSPWISILTGLIAMFLALAKRRDDLVLNVDREHRRSLGGYNAPFLDIAVTVILGALLVAYLIYTTDPQVIARYGTARLHYTAIFVAAGVLRYLQIGIVEHRSGAPTEVILSDKFLIVTFALWTAAVGVLIYGGFG